MEHGLTADIGDVGGVSCVGDEGEDVLRVGDGEDMANDLRHDRAPLVGVSVSFKLDATVFRAARERPSFEQYGLCEGCKGWARAACSFLLKSALGRVGHASSKGAGSGVTTYFLLFPLSLAMWSSPFFGSAVGFWQTGSFLTARVGCDFEILPKAWMLCWKAGTTEVWRTPAVVFRFFVAGAIATSFSNLTS